ncbi:hypothetical protein ACWDR1_16720 [Streptosporangium sandarakinum]|uniref:hypothetical protein n=1 Tax=Streptosporangium sandarakinum TaxID=1260955 RepID=UPI0033B45016
MNSPKDLQRENEIVLDVVQALLGLISPDMLAVAALVEKDRVELSFWVRHHSSQIEEDIDQAVFELDSLCSEEHPLIEAKIYVGKPDPTAIRTYGRMIYWAKY